MAHVNFIEIEFENLLLTQFCFNPECEENLIEFADVGLLLVRKKFLATCMVIVLPPVFFTSQHPAEEQLEQFLDNPHWGVRKPIIFSSQKGLNQWFGQIVITKRYASFSPNSASNFYRENSRNGT